MSFVHQPASQQADGQKREKEKLKYQVRSTAWPPYTLSDKRRSWQTNRQYS